MAREVSLNEVLDWIEKNKNRTWFREDGFVPYKRTMEMKYIRFNLDTRDMAIFALSTEGYGDLNVDFREEFDGTILDLLEYKLDQRRK